MRPVPRRSRAARPAGSVAWARYRPSGAARLKRQVQAGHAPDDAGERPRRVDDQARGDGAVLRLDRAHALARRWRMPVARVLSRKRAVLPLANPCVAAWLERAPSRWRNVRGNALSEM